jgi:chromosomal replication initiator protein
MHTFSRWVATPETDSARMAVGRVAECVGLRCSRRAVNPLYLHGPPGTGKTHLVAALAADVSRRRRDLVATVLAAEEFATRLRAGQSEEPVEEAFTALMKCDLLVVENVQHLAARDASTLVRLMDERLARHGQMVFTATAGPGQLTHLPARLTSRLASGLVVGLLPLSASSRLAFVEDRAQRRQLGVPRELLAWIAEHVGGSARQLEGAVTRLDGLVRLGKPMPDLKAVAEHFRPEVEAGRPSVERIAQRVGRYFRVEPADLQSRRRSRNALLPRQVSMYLARRLTPLSLQQIGAYFGGRDHSTVLHACRKVEQALDRDPALSGAVRDLHADLA